MKQLTVKELLGVIKTLQEEHGEKAVDEMPVYIGDDEELNGIHGAYFADGITATDEDIDSLIHGVEFKGKGLFIT